MKTGSLIKGIIIRTLIYGALVFAALLWIFSTVMISAYREKGASATPIVFNVPFEKVAIKSKDGLDLPGWWIKSKTKSDSAVVLCHGLGADKSDMLNYIPFLYRNGYNIFAFDFRGHGENLSKHTSLGFFEVNDLLGAIDYLKEKKVKNIGVIGRSMGGAVCIMTASKCKDIKAVVSDSAYARLDPLLGHYAKKFYHLPFWPVVPMVKFISQLRIGCNYNKVNPVEDIKNVHVPVCIIHGDKDENIVAENGKILFEAANEPKKLLIVPNAYHVESLSVAQKQYEKEVLEFFKKYLK